METTNWKIEGMTCATCVLTVHKYLEKAGMQQINISLASGDVSFLSSGDFDDQRIRKGINDLGYTVLKDVQPGTITKEPMNKHLRYLLFCLPFTGLLLLHMASGVLPLHWLMNPWVQLGLCLPVYICGMNFFGRSAINSLRNGIANMNLLIATGATAAFVYSLTGTVLKLGPDYLFYETSATIITLVLLGYYLEDISVRSTQKALNSLVSAQKTMANMIAYDDQHTEQVFPVENTQLRSGDLILVRTGEQVPADCKILWGEASVNEAIVTGESLPVDRHAKDILIGGSVLLSGTVRAQVTAAGEESVLARIIQMVRRAQGEKPPLQKLADRISAIFVPAVMGIALLTFVLNYVLLHDGAASLLRSIAVLVIACPCAMGLATPAAIAVGLGRAARQGILFRKASSLESFQRIGMVVFDKTGTLTTGVFQIKNWKVVAGAVPKGALAGEAGTDMASTGGMLPVGAPTGSVLTNDVSTVDTPIDETEFKRIAWSLEKYSTHPIAKCIATEWKQKNDLRWARIEEVKGLGMRGETKTGDVYWAASFRIFGHPGGAGEERHDQNDPPHNVYILRNNTLLGWIDTADTVRPESAEVVKWLHDQGIKTMLLSGDRWTPCRQLARELGIQDVLAEQSPSDKMETIARLNATLPLAMVGDGINDAPALARASIGISMSDASQLAVQTADVVLVGHGLKQLPAALGLGKYTFRTIRQNLFWAFFYNIIAIPVAALGWLTPALAALVMGFSDVILVINSSRLYVRKVT